MAHYGYVFAIGIMVDFISRILNEGPEALFFIESITAVFLMVASLFIGLLSDLSSRKLFLRLSCLVRFLGWAILLFKPEFGLLLVGMLCSDLASAMGKTSHTLYETLEGTERHSEYHSHEQKLASIPQIILMIALPLAGMAYEVDIRLPILMNVLLACAAFISTFLFTEPDRKKITGKKPVLILKEFLIFIVQTKRLRWFIIYAAIVESFTTMAIIVYQAHYISIQASLALFSSLLAGAYLIRAFGAQNGVFLIRKLGQYGALWFVLAGMIVFLILSGLSQTILMLSILMFVFMFFRGVINPVNNAYMNALVTSDRRATTFSALMTFRGLMMILTNLFIATGIEFLGTANTLVLSGVWLLIGCSVPLYLYMQADKAHREEWDQRSEVE